MKRILFYQVFFGLIITRFYCYNILVVFPEPTKSHGILGNGYVRHLLKANHNVTYITPFPWKGSHKNLTQIDVSSNLNRTREVFHDLKTNYPSESKFLLMLGYTFARMAVEHPNVQALLREPEQKFDVVVAEWIDSELYAGFAALYNCPLVWSVSTQMHWQPLRLMDEYPNPAYSPDVNSGYTAPLSFAQRAKELWIQIEKSSILYFSISLLEQDTYEECFVAAAHKKFSFIPAFEEVRDCYAAMLVNNHPSIGAVWRLPPNVRDIGGYHIEDPTKPLSKALKLVMDNSSDGVIYFSLGSTVSAKDMPDEMIKGFLQVFKRLNHTVIWKMEKPLDDVPDNVHLLNWAPQTSLLAHPNMKLFITHGGQLSVIETIHFGVPVIAIPHNVDQFANTDAIVKKGIAIRLDYNEELPVKLEEALAEMLTNKTYKWKVKQLSEVYHDRVAPPSGELVYWVEHAVRTHGALYLRSPAHSTPLYQKLYIDLFSLIITTTILTILIIYYVIKGCCIMMKCY